MKWSEAAINTCFILLFWNLQSIISGNDFREDFFLITVANGKRKTFYLELNLFSFVSKSLIVNSRSLTLSRKGFERVKVLCYLHFFEKHKICRNRTKSLLIIQENDWSVGLVSLRKRTCARLELKETKNITHFAGAFRNNIEKKSQKLRPKFKKYVCYIFADIICSVCNPVQVVIFCKNVLVL